MGALRQAIQSELDARDAQIAKERPNYVGRVFESSSLPGWGNRWVVRRQRFHWVYVSRLARQRSGGAWEPAPDSADVYEWHEDSLKALVEVTP